MCLKNVNGFKRNRESTRLLFSSWAVAVAVDVVAVATEEEAREQGQSKRRSKKRRRVSKSW